MSNVIDLGNGKTLSAMVAGTQVQLHMTRGFLALSERLTPAQAEEIGGLLIQQAKAARSNLQPVQGRG